MALPGEGSRRPDNTADAPSGSRARQIVILAPPCRRRRRVPCSTVPDWPAQAAIVPCLAPPPAAPGARARSTPSGRVRPRRCSTASPAMPARHTRPSPCPPGATPTAPEKPRRRGFLRLRPAGSARSHRRRPSTGGAGRHPRTKAPGKAGRETRPGPPRGGPGSEMGSAPFRRPEPGPPARSRGRARRSAAAGRPRRP